MRNKPRIRFKGFTEDWEQRKLGALMEVTSVKRIHQADWTDSGVRFFRARDIVSSMNNEEVDNPVFISEDKYEEYSRISGKVIEGDLLVTGVGTIGVPYLIKDATPLYFKDGNIIWFKNNNILNGKYFYYCFQNNHIQSQIYSASGKGTVGTYTIENGKKTSISYPSLKEQVQIGKLLDTMTIMITLHQHKLEKLKLAKKALLQKLFPKNGSQFPEIRFKGFTDAWEQCKLRNLLEQPITDGPHETPELYDSGITFISVDAIVDNKIDFTKMRGYISKEYDDICAKKYKPQINDVYLVKSGATIGKVAIVDTYDDFNIWSPLAAMRCGSITNPYFLYILLQTQDLQSQVFNKASHGTQPNLSMRQLEKFTCKVPKIEEQKSISRFLKQLSDVITLHQRKLDKLQDVKKGLLQKMFV